MYLLKIISLVILITVLGACSIQNERFLVGVYDVDQQALPDWNSNYPAVFPEIKRFKGNLKSSPLVIKKELPNSAQPKYTRSLQGNSIVIASFPSPMALSNYLKHKKITQVEAIQGVKLQTAFTAKTFNPMGMMNNLPSIDQVKLVSKDEFIMVNGIKMRSFVNPIVPIRIMRHMNRATPLLKAAKVSLISPYKVIKNVYGDSGLEVIFLTKWPSEIAFDQFHEENSFVKFSKATRNKAFSAFTESKAHILETKL